MLLLLTELLYLPTVWVYYNGSALWYLLPLAALAALGMGIGALLRYAVISDGKDDTGLPEEGMTGDETDEEKAEIDGDLTEEQTDVAERDSG